MDQLVQKLNAEMIKKVAGEKAVTPLSGGDSAFHQVLTGRMHGVTDKLLEKVKKDFTFSEQANVKVLSADQVNVKLAKVEEVSGTQAEGASDKFLQGLKKVNRDMLAVDATLETLLNPNVKLKPQQIIAMQAGLMNTQLMVDAFGRGVSAAAGSVRNMMNMQV